MRVKCANCGFIFNEQPDLGDGYAYPKDYEIITKCLQCGSNAYDPIQSEEKK